MDQIIARSVADRRFALELLGAFAAVALLLAAIGIYGVMSYSFSQRTHEVGIRVALGAQRLHILRMALAEGMRIVVIGLASGLLGAAIMTRFFRSMLFDVGTADPITFLSVSAILAGVALSACYIPARRTTTWILLSPCAKNKALFPNLLNSHDACYLARERGYDPCSKPTECRYCNH
jgi:putative ABC transport system permease protein